MNSQSVTVSADISRRKFLWLTAMSAAGAMVGCAANPVTGEKQLMLVSKEQEIQIDKQNSPHQFSSDYGPLQDKALNQYINNIGRTMAVKSHRTDMPYSFRGVNATYVNAYAFPGGSIAVTRGILLELDNEAELAALLGHELGHVNARHTAEQMSKGMLTQAVVGGLSVYAGTRSRIAAQLAQSIGMIGAGALLASYSRDNEREADALGMEYMVKAGYGSDGFVGLMGMLKNMSKHKPSAVEMMFATHPMGDERYRTAVGMAQTDYRAYKNRPLYRDRYMDNTARLRKIKGAIDEMQKGEKEAVQKKFGKAEAHFQRALKIAPNDYAGLTMMSKCMLVQEKIKAARAYAEMAKAVYPSEAQAHHLAGFAKIQQKKYSAAYEDFAAYDRLLPGNPNTTFFKGYALEGMGNHQASARSYHQYLQTVQQGEQAKHAYRRLVEWGYIRK
jgi:predicted Zn-dependent protease